MWAGHGLGLKPGEPLNRVFSGVAAHIAAGHERTANGRTAGLTEDLAAVLWIQLNAPLPGWFACWHSRDGRADGWRRAAGAAVGPTVHGFIVRPA